MARQEYDEDLEIVDAQVEVQPRGMLARTPWVAVAVSRARQIHWRTYVVGGVFAGALLLYSMQWKPAAKVQQALNPHDARDLPAFDEGQIVAQDRAALDQNEQQINAFLAEERQRKALAIAQGFRGLAIAYISTPGHNCAGRSELQCLNGFDANRISALTSLVDRRSVQPRKGAANPNLVFASIFAASNEVDRVEGLRLAKVLAKPENTRTDVEQQWIDLEFPILNSGLPVEELRPRPGVLAQLLQQSSQLRGKLLATSKEEALKLQQCLQLTPEQQKAQGGCQ